MMEISTALDLCAGKGGWCRGLKAAGWKTIAVDIEDWKNPWADRFILADIRRFYPSQHNLGKISLVCASPPCQEFSYKSFPFKRCKAAPPPDRSIWLACERIAQELGAPLVLENVQGARKYMGPASAHYGSFYLWGDVPPLLPIGRPRKGFGNTSNDFKELKRSNWSALGAESGGRKYSSHSPKRKEWSAQVAMIPLELATWIGQCFYPHE
jgi:site-specific DNA-cytosine methylase